MESDEQPRSKGNQWKEEGLYTMTIYNIASAEISRMQNLQSEMTIKRHETGRIIM
jgi:hypothetical protein